MSFQQVSLRRTVRTSNTVFFQKWYHLLQVIEKKDFTELRKCYVIKINYLFSTIYKHKTIEWE